MNGSTELSYGKAGWFQDSDLVDTYQFVCLEDFATGGNGNIDHLSVALQSVKSFAHVAVESSPRQQVLENEQN